MLAFVQLHRCDPDHLLRVSFRLHALVVLRGERLGDGLQLTVCFLCVHAQVLQLPLVVEAGVIHPHPFLQQTLKAQELGRAHAVEP